MIGWFLNKSTIGMRKASTVLGMCSHILWLHPSEEGFWLQRRRGQVTCSRLPSWESDQITIPTPPLSEFRPMLFYCPHCLTLPWELMWMAFQPLKNLGGKNYLDISTLKTTHRGLTHLGIKLPPSHRDSVRLKPESECERAPETNCHANRGDRQRDRA